MTDPIQHRVLVADELSPEAIEHLRARGVAVDVRPGLTGEALLEAVKGCEGLVVRSATRVTAELLLTAVFTLDRWEVYKSDTLVGSAGATVVVPRDYKNGYVYRLGGELEVAPRWKVRAGLLRDIAPTPKDRYSPSIPDGNVWAGALGASFAATPQVAIHAGYFYAWYDQVTSQGTAVLPATYDSHANIASLGLTWSTGLGAR